MFGRKTAEKLDDAAASMHRAGKKVAGERGGRVADGVATAAFQSIRDRVDEDCTRCTRGTCNGH